MPSWNKGLNKETDPRLLVQAQKVSRTLKGSTHKDAKYCLTKQQYEKLYYEDCLSLQAIADKLGCDMGSVAYWLKKHNIATRDHSTAGKLAFSQNPRPARHRHSKELYERLYCQERLSCPTIARRLGGNPEIVRYWLKKYNIPRRNNIQASRLKPTEPERKLIEIIERHDLPFKYVGNGKVILEGLSPDFININGQKQVIELFGDYWHTGAVKNWNQFEGGRIHHYAKLGFKTLILWENELTNEEKIVKRIKQLGKKKVQGGIV